MRQISITVAMVLCLGIMVSHAQRRGRIVIPDVDGYKTLKCDFHMHTVFSDGLVWPTVRVLEAYVEGLDVISITEHVDDQRFAREGYVNGTLDTSYELAVRHSAALSGDVLVIKGAELSSPAMPPGHFNAIFLRNADTLRFEPGNYLEGFEKAHEQNAFIFFNHPGWHRHTPEKTVWLKEHEEIFRKGYMQGIEVCNGWEEEYYPEAHQWALDRNLAILANTDAHRPVGIDKDFSKGEHRTMTLVFATGKSEATVRDALNNGRTAAWQGDNIYGKEEWVRKLFEACVEVTVERLENMSLFTFTNRSDLGFDLVKREHDPDIAYFRTMRLPPHGRLVLDMRHAGHVGDRPYEVRMDVDNMHVAPGKGLSLVFKVE